MCVYVYVRGPVTEDGSGELGMRNSLEKRPVWESDEREKIKEIATSPSVGLMKSLQISLP